MWPSDAIWCHGPGTTLLQLMASLDCPSANELIVKGYWLQTSSIKPQLNSPPIVMTYGKKDTGIGQ